MHHCRTRVKICGLTRPDDIDAVVAAGADAIGFVMYPGSKRAVSIDAARLLRRRVPAFVNVVTLFVNADPADVHRTIDLVQPDLLQFHGDESPDYCASFGHRYLRAFRVGGPGTETAPAVRQACEAYPHASGWLFDSYSAGYGGSGLAFDPLLLDQVSRSPNTPALILAGGLTPATVTESIAALHPFAVDVSSGVEQAPGVKSADKIRAFLAAVARADAKAQASANPN